MAWRNLKPIISLLMYQHKSGVTPKDDPEGNNGETTNDQNHHDDANPDDGNQKMMR